MKKDTEKAEVEKILKTIEAHPLTQKIREEENLKTLEARLLAAAKLREVVKEAEEVIPRLMTDLSGAEADLREYDEGRKVVLEKVILARKRLGEERLSLDRERSEAEAALLSNYDPIIDSTILWFRDRHEVLLHKSIDKQTHAGETNVYTLTKELITFSNAAAIRSALGYCRATIEQLEKMKLIPELDAEKIERLKAAVPDIGAYTEITTEKPLPKGPSGIIYRSDYEDEQTARLLRRKI